MIPYLMFDKPNTKFSAFRDTLAPARRYGWLARFVHSSLVAEIPEKVLSLVLGLANLINDYKVLNYFCNLWGELVTRLLARFIMLRERLLL